VAAPGDTPLAKAVEAPSHTGPSSLPHDLSPWGMFLAADNIVKGVMIGLAFASLMTWTVCLAKALELFFAKRRLRSALAKLAVSSSLQDAIASSGFQRGRVAQFVTAAMDEAERSAGLPVEGTKERAAALLSRLEQRAGRAMTMGTGVLATIGATAPFVGLFGTVWGIMNSFIGISKANTTNLAVVAPGIAEALLATAIGLVAAIPAVVIYNLFARQISGYKAMLADASSEVMRHLSRDLDRLLFDADDTDERVVMMRRSAE
jgi:biopolymer transport protein ExbB